jgi:hypothetical protein
MEVPLCCSCLLVWFVVKFLKSLWVKNSLKGGVWTRLRIKARQAQTRTRIDTPLRGVPPFNQALARPVPVQEPDKPMDGENYSGV